MTAFTIKLADIPIGITALFHSTKNFCRDYLTDASPVFTVFMTAEDLIRERKRNDQQTVPSKPIQTDFSDGYIEKLALYRKITAELLRYDILLFHGAVLAYDGKAYVFTAKSGTGKTTHVSLWLKHIPGCHILNGDKPLLLFKNGIVYACGTPWMGKEKYGVNEILPVAGICLLERAEDNRIERVSLTSILPQLIFQSHRPEGSHTLLQIIKLLKNLETGNLYRLGCNMEPDAAITAYNGIILGDMK